MAATTIAVLKNNDNNDNNNSNNNNNNKIKENENVSEIRCDNNVIKSGNVNVENRDGNVGGNGLRIGFSAKNNANVNNNNNNMPQPTNNFVPTHRVHKERQSLFETLARKAKESDDAKQFLSSHYHSTTPTTTTNTNLNTSNQSFSPQLNSWLQKCFEMFRNSNFNDLNLKNKLNEVLKERIEMAKKDGTIHTKDWSNEPLPSFC